MPYGIEAELLLNAQIDGLGELRIFRRDGPPPHLAFEILQEADGRAWTLRVPQGSEDALRRLVQRAREIVPLCESVAYDETGSAAITGEPLPGGDELALVMMRESGDYRLAFWRRERVRVGWSWSLDVLFVPIAAAIEVCGRIDEVLGNPSGA